VATVAIGEPGQLLYLVDKSTDQAFLVDSGSAYSILPHTSSSQTHGPKICSAARKRIRCWGSKDRQLSAGDKAWKWRFLLADVGFPIIGADFLSFYNLTVDLRGRRLLDPVSKYSIPLSVVPRAWRPANVGVVAAEPGDLHHGRDHPRSERGSPAEQRDQVKGVAAAAPTCQAGPSGRYQKLLQRYVSVVNPSKVLPPVKHKVQHSIETTCARPVTARYRRLDPVKLRAAKEEFDSLEAQGLVKKSKSAWSSPLHMAKKKDGTYRPCGDYRLLNLATKPDQYPPPHMGDLAARLAGCTVFSTLDLRKGYHQVPLREEDREKTAIITPFGLYEYNRMPFGLRNAGQTFQRLMDDVMRELDFCFTYMDDVMLASKNHDDHEGHLEEVLKRLQEQGLVLNIEKCVLGQPEVTYLGHLVSAKGVQPLPSRVEAIVKHPKPKDKGQLMSFLGMINFYRKFIKGAAEILRPLTDSTKGSAGKKSPLVWTPVMVEAFEKAKRALQAAALLVHPEVDAEMSLHVDASDHHVGGALQQWEKGRGWRPLGFFSRKLSDTEKRYSTFDRELLAGVAAIRHFRYMLEGRTFTLYTDHKPLTHALARLSDAWTARQQRHLAFIAEFTSDIRHVKGAENVVADTLSRPAAAITLATQAAAMDWKALAVAQATGEARSKLSGTSLQLQCVNVAGADVLCDVTTGVWRPVLVGDFRRQAFTQVHGLAHVGVRATTRMLAARFVWPGLARDTKEWCKQCIRCANSKSTLQEKTQS